MLGEEGADWDEDDLDERAPLAGGGAASTKAIAVEIAVDEQQPASTAGGVVRTPLPHTTLVFSSPKYSCVLICILLSCSHLRGSRGGGHPS